MSHPYTILTKSNNQNIIDIIFVGKSRIKKTIEATTIQQK